MDSDIRVLLAEIKQKGYLSERYTKASSTSREHDYYIDLNASHNKTVEFRMLNGRAYSEIFDKLGRIEDMLEKISIDQLAALMKTKGK